MFGTNLDKTKCMIKGIPEEYKSIFDNGSCKNNEGNMFKISKEYKWFFYCEDCSEDFYKVKITKINPKYFRFAISLHSEYESFFEDLTNYSSLNGIKLDIVEFLKQSVIDENMINECLIEEEFKVVDDHIFSKIENRRVDFINTGEFIIENYKVNTSFSYMFFTNLSTNVQFVYSWEGVVNG